MATHYVLTLRDDPSLQIVNRYAVLGWLDDGRIAVEAQDGGDDIADRLEADDDVLEYLVVYLLGEDAEDADLYCESGGQRERYGLSLRDPQRTSPSTS